MNSLFRSFVLAILLFAVVDASAQFGVRAKYNMNSFSEWDNYLENLSGDVDKVFPTNIELGLDYWFRLKNYRIEFMPEVAMGLKTSSSYPTNTSTANFSYFAFNLNTHIYLFDLEGDCDCPTFSKQGPSLNKGFFFSLSPGLVYSNKDVPEGNFNSNQINFRIGLGIGYDLGISDLFTITPMISYHLTPGLTYDGLTYIYPPLPSNFPSTSLKQIQFQLRFGFRPDYVKSYGRGRR